MSETIRVGFQTFVSDGLERLIAGSWTPACAPASDMHTMPNGFEAERRPTCSETGM